MDNFQFDVTYEGNDKLSALMQILCNRKVVGYRVSPQKGLIFYWTDSSKPGYHKFPFAMKQDQAAAFASAWLFEAQYTEYEEEPDIDGSCGKGWRLYNESWGHVDGEWQASLAIMPAWAMHGK